MTNRTPMRPRPKEKSPPFRLPEYWLGVSYGSMSQGIIVQEVVPDSPAAKAGFAQNDIIVKVNDKKITDVSEVLQAVEAAKDKEMKLEIIRDGQPKTIAVTPAKRPEEARIPFRPRNLISMPFASGSSNFRRGAGSAGRARCSSSFSGRG